MADISTIIITAGCTLFISLSTLSLTMINNYYSDKRKSHSEKRLSMLLKKVSVGEEFYALSGLSIQQFIKMLHFYESIDGNLSQASYNILHESMKEKTAYVKMVSEREKSHTPVNLFFDVKSTFESSQRFENVLIELFAEIAEVDINTLGGNEIIQSLHIKLKDTLNKQIKIMQIDRKIVQDEIQIIMSDINK